MRLWQRASPALGGSQGLRIWWETRGLVLGQTFLRFRGCENGGTGGVSLRGKLQAGTVGAKAGEIFRI